MSPKDPKEIAKKFREWMRKPGEMGFSTITNWIDLPGADKQELRQKHIKKVREHQIKIKTYWITLSQDRKPQKNGSRI